MANANDLGPWDPMIPSDIAILFTGYPGIWCIAGGWALDLFCGVESRPHDDIDVLVLRDDLALLHKALPGWELHAAHGTLAPWHAGTSLPDAVHDIWCRKAGRSDSSDEAVASERPWQVQLIVLETDGDDWLFRRDDRIRGPLRDLTCQRDGLPVLVPEIQLLYKARLPNRPKDEADFTTVAPHLRGTQRHWLARFISLLYPELPGLPEHPWLAALLHER